MAAQAGEDAWRCRGCGDHVTPNQRLYRTVSEAWHSSCFRATPTAYGGSQLGVELELQLPALPQP